MDGADGPLSALPFGRACGAGGIVPQSSLERVLQSITEHVFNLTTQLLIGLSRLAGRSLAGALSQHDGTRTTLRNRSKLKQTNKKKQSKEFARYDWLFPKRQNSLHETEFLLLPRLRTKSRPFGSVGRRGVIRGTHLGNERCCTDGQIQPPREK